MILGGRYVLQSLLGQGAFGRVFSAVDASSGDEVAIKLFVPRAGHRAAAEAARVARVTHPNVLPVLEAGEHDGSPYLVMPRVHGVSLSEHLRAGAVTPRRAVDLLSDIAAGLDAVHAAGIVHRDVTPSNILIAERPLERALLVDFGTVATIDADVSRGFAGTPGYAAPEQLDGDVAPASDVYALGAVLYECVTGRRPMPVTAEPAAVAHDVDRDEQDVERALRPVFVRALALDPAQRFRHASEVTAAARAALDRLAPELLDMAPASAASDRRPPPTTAVP